MLCYRTYGFINHCCSSQGWHPWQDWHHRCHPLFAACCLPADVLLAPAAQYNTLVTHKFNMFVFS